MRGTCCKRSSETTWHFPNHGSLPILLKYSFSWISFPRSLICKNLNVNSSLVCQFKFAKLDMFLKIQPGSGSICKYDVKNDVTLVKHIWLCMMGTMKLIFIIGFLIKKVKKKFNVVCNSSWDISSEKFVKYLFVKITLNKNKVPSSFQNFSSYKNSSFCKV